MRKNSTLNPILPFLILALALLGFSLPITARIIYLAPNGNDNNSGTLNSPWFTLNKAWTVVAAGDTIYMRGGTYNYNTQQYITGRNGTAANMIKIWAYPGEKPNITQGNGYPSNGQDLIYFEGNYLHFKGLEISYADNTSADWSAMRSQSSNNCIFELLDYHHNQLGFTIRNCNNNLVLNCDFHHNQDAALDNADGINITYITNGNFSNTIRGCRAWNNSDDGFDFWSNNGYVLIENSWAWKNGYQQNGTSPAGDGSGFKFGEYSAGATTTVKRRAQNCISVQNKLWGFNENNCVTGIQLYNNIAYANGNKGYWFGDWGNNTMTVRNNANYQGAVTFNSANTTATHNSWQNGITVNNADFQSMDATQLLLPRKPDGSLPDITFLQPVANSDLVDAGFNVGLPFVGSAPDIGAFEFGTNTNQAPTANAGINITITWPVNTATLVGTGTDPDGTVTAYQWTKIAGPTSFTIVTPTLPTTIVNNLAQGVYEFELTVTDNEGATGRDTIQVTVGSATNQPPTANAGSNITITLPVSTVTLNGSGTDPDGTIVSYAWSKISGTGGTITSPSSATTTVTGLSQGSYTFRLTVTDNGGLTDTDNVVVTVNPAAPATGRIWYLAPNGNDNNAGTITSPFFTLNKAWTVMAAGDTIYLRGGTYNLLYKPELTGINGTAANPIKVWNYPGETPILTEGPGYPSGTAHEYKGIYFSGNYIHWKGIIVTGFTDSPSAFVASGMRAQNVNNCIFEQMVFHHNGQGFMVTGNSANNLVLNCDAYANSDPHDGYENGDGISFSYCTGGSNNIVRNCRSWDNCDDGFDTFEHNGTITFENCWSWRNGYVPGTNTPAGDGEGWKLHIGGNSYSNTFTRFLYNCVSFKNRNSGFHQEEGNTRMRLHNNIAFDNKIHGFFFNYGTNNAHELRNNVSFGNDNDDVELNNNTVHSNNSTGSANSWGWTNNVTNADFLSVSESGVDGPRQPDGSLPNINFLQLAASSDLVDAGINVGLPFNGVAPDRGAHETGGTAVPNQPPVANAGTNKNITLPTNSITQVGSGTDPDGTITGYLWTKISGPNTFTIVSPTQATTVINNLVQGVYQFELRVTDNQGAIDRDTMQVTVNAAPNQAPNANAGTDKNITLPTNSITQVGSGTDPDGTITGYLWTKVSGPNTFTIVSPAQATTVINNLVQGVYQFELRVTDNQGAIDRDTMQVTVNAAPNQAPNANAGTDKNITLPTNSITQVGSGTDPDGTITGYLWTKVSGPNTFTIVSPTQATTVINNLVQGVYQFELRVTDNQGATDRDTMQVTVNAAPNQAPSANAGTDKNITLPTNSITQVGSGTDPDGTITGYLWTKVSGPNTFTIVSPAQATTVINNLVQGVYQFELRVTDNQGAIDRDTMQVTVNAAPPPPNQPPVANAGTDKNITLPTNSITQVGTGSDPDGTITAYLWTKVSGPNTFTIVSPTQATTVINNLVQGVYQFELRVTDNQGAIDRDTMQVTVNAAPPPPNQPPVANAGTDKTITLPTSSITQVGSGTDPDGTITSYQWAWVSGPAQYVIISPAQATTVINNLVQGVYRFELIVTDNQGASGRDTMQVTVNAAPPPNQAPSANAGTDKNITLPTNSITQVGSGTDPDGTITAYLWTKVSGPNTFTIVSPAQATTVINNLVQGVYQFELRVTDNQGAIDRDTMQVTVNAAPPPTNQLPVANAGTDKNITLPVNSITQAGSGSDPDGTITAYLWTKISGPSTFTIVSPTSATTVINNLVQGVYQFELRVTDNQGAIDRDTMQVTVNAAPPPPNQPPVAFAGEDSTITLPVRNVTITGSGADTDGNIVSYQWSWISGPVQYTIVSPTQPQTEFADLVAGVYEFELAVTDNQGAIARDTLRITVLEDPNRISTAIVYPNPATDHINVRIDAITNMSQTRIQVYDVRGILVAHREVMRTQQVQTFRIDINHLPNGTYFLTIDLDINNRRTITFIKQSH